MLSTDVPPDAEDKLSILTAGGSVEFERDLSCKS
jgi:hypothetical protein